MKQRRTLQLSAWIISLFVATIGIIAWSDTVRPPLSISDVYPLLGILAFSLMWSHYISGTLRRKLDQEKQALKTYFQLTSALVLVSIVLHPGLFYLQLYNDGLGLPPESYLAVYTDAAARFALFLGTLSLIIFLAFELKRKFGEASWWRYVEYANVAAMFAIFYHALTLGGDLMNGWYRTVWFTYGVILIASVVYNNYYDRRSTWIKKQS